MTSPLSVHWIPTHVGDIGGKHDRAWLRAWSPRFVKVVTNDETIPHFEDIPADAKIIVRNYPLSEQGHDRGFATEAFAAAAGSAYQNGSPKDALVSGPGAFALVARPGPGLYGMADTPDTVAAEHVASHVRVRSWAEARGIGRDRLLFEGLNEPMFWSSETPALVARYEAARLQIAHQHELHLVVLNAGVGWPGNGGVADAPVNWTPFAAMFAEMRPGDYLGLHEYWALNGPQENWRWWAGRYEQCPARVPILITECGIDTGVTGQFFGGWRNLPGQMTERARRFMDELLWYWGKCWQDSRVQGIFPFSYDRGSDTWLHFDLRNEDLLKEIVLRAGTFAQPQAFTWTAPVPEPPPAPKGFWDAVKTVFGAQCVDVRDRLITNGAYYQRKLDTIQRVVVHHTAASVKTTWSQVAKYHVETKRYPGIAYHLGITPDGGLSYLGDIADMRYHAGAANTDSIGICFAGNYMEDEPTAASLATFARLLSVIEAYLGRQVKVVGHRDVGETLCPGDKLYAALFAVPDAPPAPPEPEPEPEPQPEIKVFDKHGQARSWDWLVATYNVTRLAAAAGKRFVLTEVRETEGEPAVVVQVLGTDGAPLPSVQCMLSWPDGPHNIAGADYRSIWEPRGKVQETDSNGFTGFGVGAGSLYAPGAGAGPHSVWVLHNLYPSDGLRGVGTVSAAARGPLRLVFRLTDGAAAPLTEVALAAALLAAGRQAEQIALNPDAALLKRILSDKCYPTSPEFTVGIGQGQITAQTARKVGESLRVYWCWTGDWGNVQVVS